MKPINKLIKLLGKLEYNKIMGKRKLDYLREKFMLEKK